MSKYLLLIHENEGAYVDGTADYDAIMGMHGDFAATAQSLGIEMLGGEALRPTSTATFLRGTRTSGVHAVDNPLPEVKEVLGGFYLIDAADQAQAVKLAEACPAPYGYIEVRPIWDVSGGSGQ